MRTRISFVLAVTALLAAAGLADERSRLLIPLYLDHEVPGSFGTRWRTALTIVNATDHPVEAFQARCLFECTCVIPASGCVGRKPIEPYGEYAGGLERNDDIAAIPAILFNVIGPRDQLAMSLRLVNEGGGGAGTEIPIVHEDEFRTGTTWLAGVPAARASRVHLRVYFISSPDGDGFVRVRFYASDGSTVGDEIMRAIRPFTGPVAGRDDEDAMFPGFAQLLIPTTSSREPSRIRIDTLTPGLEYWAMLSITDNATQSVTLVTPQP